MDLEKGAIKPPSVPNSVKANRALNQLKNLGNKKNSVDGVNNRANKTLGQPEEDRLRKEQGLPDKNPAQYESAGGEARRPNRSAPENQEEDMPEEDEGGDELEAQQNRQGQPTPPTTEAEEQIPPPEQTDDRDDKSDSSGKESGKPNIAKAFANRWIDRAKKLFAKEKWVAFWAANWPWILGVVGVLILVIGGFLIFNYLFGSANENPSSTGQSMTQVWDPARDRPTLQAVLQLSGDKASQELSAWTFTKKLQDELESLKADAGLATRPDKDELIGKINIILGDIQTYSISKDSATAKKIVNGVKELWEMFGTLPSLADAGSPLPKDSILGFTNNFHDGTPMNPCPAKGCPAGHRTFYQTERNTCDAVDLKAKNGTPVYAAFAGKVMKKGSDGKNGQLVFIQNDAGYLAVYAHMSDTTLKLNEVVKTGQQIGKVGSGHLHFELAKNGKCVTSIPLDKTEAKLNKKSVGYFLWLRMAKVLNSVV